MIAPILALGASALLLVWLVHSFGIIGFAAFCAFAVFVLWPLATWFFRDDEPLLGPASPNRVTFKQVLKDAARDVIELAAPAIDFAGRFWRWAAPKVTNPTTWAAIGTNAALAWPLITDSAAGQVLREEFPWLYLVGAFVALLATRQTNAPYRVPVSGPSPTGGLVNNTALA